MCVLFGAHELLDIVDNGFDDLVENATDAQRNAQRSQEEGL